MKRTRPALFLAAALLLAAPALHATTVVPGQTVTPELLSLSSDSTLFETSGNFSFGTFGLGEGHISGTFEQGVMLDPFDLTCDTCLDFFYRVDLDANPDSNRGIILLVPSAFSGYTTSVGYVPTETGGLSPLSASRAADGSFVSFAFATMTDATHIIAPGTHSMYLIIATNATSFDQNGKMGVLGGAPDFVGGAITGLYSPVPVPVPLPGGLVLLASGLGGLVAARRRKTVAQAS